MLKIFYTFVCILLLFNITFGGGFELYEFGACASSLSGTVVARAWDASTIFYNPSGLAFLEGTNFYGGVTLISATNRFVGAEPIFDGTVHDSKSALHTPIQVVRCKRQTAAPPARPSAWRARRVPGPKGHRSPSSRSIQTPDSP